ncbi:putative lea domain protein [Rosellinia necatrix]|uniref:Putative lea domain protein n=1 Tax=Rosellinia necatrix TaxID=77044 RepID=A0A1W2TFB8_ROSNE|nr:putative lea domain protein [Rosellinia necatrix]
MADSMVPQTPPKKLFKPSSKTRTPTRSKPSPHSASSTDRPQRTAHSAPRSVASVASEPAEPLHESTVGNAAKSTNLAPLTNISAASDRPPEQAGSDTTGETSVGLAGNHILTPSETASRSTGARSPLSRSTSQNTQGPSPTFKDRLSHAEQSAKQAVVDLAKTAAVGKPTGAPDNTISDPPHESDNLADALDSPTTIAEYFKDQGNFEMSDFVTSLAGKKSPSSPENTPRAVKSPANEAHNLSDRADRIPNSSESDELDRAGNPGEAKDTRINDFPVPADVSMAADGSFRDTKDDELTIQPIKNMGEPNVSDISQAAQPVIPSAAPASKRQSSEISQPGDRNGAVHVVDNMGRPVHLERSIEIPLQRPKKEAISPPDPSRRRTESQDLGDFEDLPEVENLPSTGGIPKISDVDSQDPPEEILDPSVHSTSTNITPIPKIPKISHIDSSAPAGLLRLAKGLAGHVIDDVGNVVDESSDEVLGHVTGDLPAMVGKKVSDDGEVYGDEGQIVGYVSENFISPPSPTEIPSDVLGRLRVDHQGNILDSDGKIIGKFHQPPHPSKSSASRPSQKEEPEEEQKPKLNANTGGSPSDLFLDVKSTTDGIQLTIRIPTTFSRPPPES